MFTATAMPCSSRALFLRSTADHRPTGLIPFALVQGGLDRGIQPVAKPVVDPPNVVLGQPARAWRRVAGPDLGGQLAPARGDALLLRDQFRRALARRGHP